MEVTTRRTLHVRYAPFNQTRGAVNTIHESAVFISSHVLCTLHGSQYHGVGVQKANQVLRAASPVSGTRPLPLPPPLRTRTGCPLCCRAPIYSPRRRAGATPRWWTSSRASGPTARRPPRFRWRLSCTVRKRNWCGSCPPACRCTVFVPAGVQTAEFGSLGD